MQQRGDVLQHVDVGVPLEEAEVGALGDPVEDLGLGALEVLGAGEAGDGERLVGVALAGEVLDREVDDPMVLGPEPEVVDAVGGQRIVVAVPVGEHPLVDGGDHLGRELRHRRVALAEGEHRVQVHQLEVAGVLPVVDLLEDARQRLDGDVVDVPRVVGVAQGLGEVDGDAGHVRRVLDAGGEGEVLDRRGPGRWPRPSVRAIPGPSRAAAAALSGAGAVESVGTVSAIEVSVVELSDGVPASSPVPESLLEQPATTAAVAPAPAIRNRRRFSAKRRNDSASEGSEWSPGCTPTL